MLMSASAYNLKKYLKYFQKKQKTGAKVVKAALHYFIVIIRVEIKAYKPLTL